MLKDNKGYIAAAIGLMLVASLLGAGFSYFDHYDSYRVVAHASAPPVLHHLSDTGRIANAVESIRDDQQSAGVSDREARDLGANEAQARWARWSAWAAVVQFFVSTAGLVVLFRTFNQTDSALTISRDQFEAGYKPWIDVQVTGPYIADNDRRYVFHDDENDRYIHIRVRAVAQNVGENPITIRRGRVGILMSNLPNTDYDGIEYNILLKDQQVDLLRYNAKPEKVGIEYPQGDMELRVDKVGVFRYPKAEQATFRTVHPVFVCIECENAIGQRYEIRRTFAPSAMLAVELRSWGGDEHNYIRRCPDTSKQRRASDLRNMQRSS